MAAITIEIQDGATMKHGSEALRKALAAAATTATEALNAATARRDALIEALRRLTAFDEMEQDAGLLVEDRAIIGAVDTNAAWTSLNERIVAIKAAIPALELVAHYAWAAVNANETAHDALSTTFGGR